MNAQKLRPFVTISYDVNLSFDEWLLQYSNLNLKYVEEKVVPQARGYAVIERSTPKYFKIPEYFGWASINRDAPDRYLVQLVCPEPIIGELQDYEALPYGHPPIDLNEADQYKQPDALIRYLQRRVIQNFELDAIRAIIGDFKTAYEVESKAQMITDALRQRWEESNRISRDRTISGFLQFEKILTLGSPVIRQGFSSNSD